MSIDSSIEKAATEIAATAAKHDERDNARARSAPSQLGGMLWFAGWLFTVGFADLGWWKGVLAVIAWPYFLGVFLRP